MSILQSTNILHSANGVTILNDLWYYYSVCLRSRQPSLSALNIVLLCTTYTRYNSYPVERKKTLFTSRRYKGLVLGA
ncbi:hypothetical protein HBH70_166130 [Parastagonospora nodorum]|nr:hypothetical protein HBH53_158100 [Parastagonospora nodorum]KAH3959332.1 hypothetical protein HBH52_244900 [Parastagonospora nodorum]KAH3963345.1 hypothetical protein HBH51_166610 [Parastagonospora nodorum]KAH3995224.1 hypothetical protein HBI10_175120 [Parastagonospora nodorum]KAH4012675.1 hypothetical protein HBI09_221830 [Parastagonospora nodorum]